MPYLLRRARKTAWAGAWPVTAEQRAIAVETFARRTEDTDGVSLFEVVSEEEETLVVAAVACDRLKDDAVDLLHLERAEIERLGRIAHTLGTLPVPRANALHRSLDWAEEALVALVDGLLAERRTAVRHTRATVRRAVAGLEPADVDEGPWRDFALRVQATSARGSSA